MTDNLKLIKEESIIIKAEEKSQDILIQDPADSEVIHLSFLLKFITDGERLYTDLSVSDAYHGMFTIRTKPNGWTRPTEKIQIGTYGHDKAPLYVDYELDTNANSAESHKLKVSVYTTSED